MLSRTSSSERSMKIDESKPMSSDSPGGSVWRRLSSSALTARATSSVLALDC
jgi:hypothetical protein